LDFGLWTGKFHCRLARPGVIPSTPRTVSFAPRRQPAIVFIFVTLVLDIIGIGLVVPILPKLVQAFQHGDEQAAAGTYGVLASLYALMQFVFAPLLGSLSDRFGRRRVILLSLFGSGLDYFLFAFAPGLAWLYVARIISGITGANISAASAYIADVSPPEKRAANFGLIGAAFGIGFIAGPALGGWLGSYSLKLPFLVAGGLTLLNWLYGYFVLPESLAPENRRAFSWKRSNPVGSLLALQRYPIVLGLTGTYFLINIAHSVFPATWVLYTSHRYHWSPTETGLSLAVVGLMAGLVQGGLTRVIVGKFGERKTAVFGMCVWVISFTLYGLATKSWMVYVILICGSIGSVMGPSVQGLISRNVGADEQGGVQGSLASLASVAGIIGPLIATSLFAYFISAKAPVYLPGAAFFCSSALVLVGLALAVRSFRKGIQAAPKASEPAVAEVKAH
jgi:MFS transporter, DHA1 family, tetracycline resistance protein